MTVNINAANITSIRLAEQGSDPGTPASGFASLFVDTNGDLATRKDAGGIKIATSPASGDWILTVDGTGTAARLNAANVFTSAQVMPAGTNSAPALTTTGDTNTGIYFPAADNIGFSTGGTIRGRWTTDGLCFGSDTAAANALDDYEEGTWTPVIVGTSTAGTASYTNQHGRYTKIGRMVYIECYVAWSGGSGTGNLRIDGLPFNSANIDTFPSLAIGAMDNIPLTAANVPMAYINKNTDEIVPWQSPIAGGTSVAVPYDAAGAIQVAGSYTV
jgi:hypothetical protein